jgi:ribonucleotide reductase alpha subunit
MWVYPESRNDCGSWLPAEEIYVGDSLLNIDKRFKEVAHTCFYNAPHESSTYYDLEVENTHCYFVTGRLDPETSAYLSHNSATIHFPIFNEEIEDIIMLKDNSGTEENRVRSMDYSICISKLFYQRFIENKDISLFSTYYTPGLVDVFGLEEFDALYEKYEQDLSIPRKTVSAQKLFLEIVKQRSQTGRIYILNVDNANEHSPFLDVVQMSNLCVAYESLLLTNEGYFQIGTLENQAVTIWNGEEWSDTIVRKTSENQPLLTVVFSNGTEIDCTPYHKFPILNETLNYDMVCASNLKIGDTLINCKYPSMYGVYDLEDEIISVESVIDYGRVDETYCLTEPKRNLMVINGVIVGNCQEILQPSRPLTSWEQLV